MNGTYSSFWPILLNDFLTLNKKFPVDKWAYFEFPHRKIFQTLPYQIQS